MPSEGTKLWLGVTYHKLNNKTDYLKRSRFFSHASLFVAFEIQNQKRIILMAGPRLCLVDEIVIELEISNRRVWQRSYPLTKTIFRSGHISRSKKHVVCIFLTGTGRYAGRVGGDFNRQQRNSPAVLNLFNGRPAQILTPRPLSWLSFMLNLAVLDSSWYRAHTRGILLDLRSTACVMSCACPIVFGVQIIWKKYPFSKV